MNSTVELAIADHVATLTLNRPEVKNAIDAEVIALLSKHLTNLNSNQNIRIIVLQGKGNCFCAGADLIWMQQSIKHSLAENKADAHNLAKMLQLLYVSDKITIANIHGAAFGGAVGLVACCDLAIASDTAKFCLAEVKVGLSPAVISPYIFQAIGHRAASKLMLTAEVITANQALTLNLVQQVVPAATLNKTLQDLIAQLLQNSPQALRATKQLLRKLATTAHSNLSVEVMDYTVDLIAKLRVSAEGQEGLTAFLEKRKPAWI